MQRGIVMTEDQEDAKSNLNKSDPHINHGVELLLRNRRENQNRPKLFQIKFGKMVALFRRDFFPPELLSGHQKEIVSGGQKMLAVTLTIGTLVSIMMFL